MADSSLSVCGLIKKHSIEQPDKMAFVIDDNIISYKELFRKISSAAEFFRKSGLKEGSHVVTVANQSQQFVVCMYALLGIGAVHIPVENRAPAARISEIAKAVDADIIISQENPDCGIRWISVDGVDYDGESDLSWTPALPSDACSEIIFTTGTTGKSKGVMLSLNCLDAYTKTMQPSFKLTPESVFIVTTPLNHIGGLHRIHQCMTAGSGAVLMDGIRNLKGFFDAIYKYNVTHTYLPPASVKLILSLAKKELAKLDGKLQFIFTASAPFPTKDIETLVSIMPHTHLHQGYGSSETGSICNCCYNAPEESIESLGKPYPCVEVMLLDENGCKIEVPNKAGRIASKSAMNMLGYYNEPELTATVLKDGYIYSSDILFFDEQGRLHFAGRNDDVINVKGFKVSPLDVENCAMRHPAIDECLCIPYDDKFQGRTIKLLVKLKNGATFDAGDIARFLSDQLEPYKIPKYIDLIDEITRKPNGKIDRKHMIMGYSNI